MTWVKCVLPATFCVRGPSSPSPISPWLLLLSPLSRFVFRFHLHRPSFTAIRQSRRAGARPTPRDGAGLWDIKEGHLRCWRFNGGRQSILCQKSETGARWPVSKFITKQQQPFPGVYHMPRGLSVPPNIPGTQEATTIITPALWVRKL